LALLGAALALSIACRHQNHPPEPPDRPDGRTSVPPDSLYAYTTSAIDADGDSVSCQFDWGDSTLSGWTEYAASGAAASVQRAWTTRGAFLVRARAQDRHGAMSDWSHGRQVAVGNRAPWPPPAPVMLDTGTAPLSYIVATATRDPNNDSISYQLDRGYGDTTAWSGFVPSGVNAYLPDTWISGGDYVVRVRARDNLDAVSDWSAGHLLHVSGPVVPWRVDCRGTPYYVSPTVGPDGTVYVVRDADYLCAVNPDGAEKWRFRTPGAMDCPPLVGSDGRVYASSGSYLYSLLPNGTLNWVLSRDHVPEYRALALAGDTVLYSPGDELLAMDRQGTIRWRTAACTGGSAVITEDGAVYYQRNHELIALNPDSSIRWTAFLQNGSMYGPPALGANGMIYCTGNKDTLYAYDASGNVVWTCPVGDKHNDPLYAAPAIGTDGMLYCGYPKGLRAVSSVGARKWAFLTAGRVRTTPAIAADGTIYFGCDDRYLYALTPDGTLKWRYDLGHPVRSSPVIGADGRVYIVSYDGYLYAIEGGSPPADSPWPMYMHDARHTGWAGTR
jgi:outer membrane protein assembly factor BamB